MSMIGKTIGKNRIVGQLGRGGMGTVYRAVDEVLGREVALKILNSKLADSDLMERFRREAILLAKLNHPRIATIYELFRSEGDLLMVMELVRGETLDKISDRMGALPPDSAAYLIDQILSALEHAHRGGVVHRDLKPANVMVTEHGDLKVMDFGIARVRVAEHVDSYMVGTPAYMSPEQILGQNVDGRADLYSVGIVFYRLLTSALPFKADTALGMLQKQLSDPPTPLHAHRGDLPEWCDAIVQRALAKEPRERFQTAEEFRKQLAEATGIVTTNVTKALSIRIADDPTTITPGPSVLERFGATLLSPPASPVGLSAGTDRRSEVGRTSTGDITSNPPDKTAEGTTVVLQSKHAGLRRWSLPILAGMLAALLVVAVWRLIAGTAAITEDVPLPAAENTSGPPPRRSGTSPNPPTAQSLPPASTSATSTASTETSAARAAPRSPATISLADPVAFRARTLVSDGDRWRERESQVIVVDGKISVQANDDHALLYAVSYGSVLSISYSRGRDPVWNGPEGLTRIVRAGARPFGIFRGARHWVTLRTRNANAQVLVLRLDKEAQAWRAITVIEERTGRIAEVVTEPSE